MECAHTVACVQCARAAMVCRTSVCAAVSARSGGSVVDVFYRFGGLALSAASGAVELSGDLWRFTVTCGPSTGETDVSVQVHRMPGMRGCVCVLSVRA